MLCACLRRALGGQAVVRACVTCVHVLGGNPRCERVQKNPETSLVFWWLRECKDLGEDLGRTGHRGTIRVRCHAASGFFAH